MDNCIDLYKDLHNFLQDISDKQVETSKALMVIEKEDDMAICPICGAEKEKTDRCDVCNGWKMD